MADYQKNNSPNGDNFWKLVKNELSVAGGKEDSEKKKMIKQAKYLFPLNETEEFYDPFSDVSLFLAKRVKDEVLKEKDPQKWSTKIERLLLNKILPEFTRQFPRYRLGKFALKKTWNKVSYYTKGITRHTNAFTDQGNLNVDFMIRKNLNELTKTHSFSDVNPVNLAGNLALKISECIATVDGERLNLDNLTRRIWAVQKHLIPKNNETNRLNLEKYDPLDKLIVRFQLEQIAESPTMPQVEVAKNLRKKIETMRQLSKISQIEEIEAELSQALAEKLTPVLKIHDKISKEEMETIISFIKKHKQMYETKNGALTQRDYIQLVQRILFLYQLSMNLSEKEAKFNLQTAISYVHSLSSEAFSPKCPVLRQKIYTLINYEITKIKQKMVSDPITEVLNTLLSVFNDAKGLPRLSNELFSDLEVLTWKVLSDEKQLKAKLPAYLKEFVHEELANVHIESKSMPFQKIVQMTIHYLKKIRTIDTSDLDFKIGLWTIQNDMVCRWLHFDNNHAILKSIKRTWKDVARDDRCLVSSKEFVELVLKKHLENNKQLSGWKDILRKRILILYKYFWYNQSKEETSYSRFLKWHLNELNTAQERQFTETIVTSLENISNTLVPLTPLKTEHCRSLVYETNAHKVSYG